MLNQKSYTRKFVHQNSAGKDKIDYKNGDGSKQCRANIFFLRNPQLKFFFLQPQPHRKKISRKNNKIVCDKSSCPQIVKAQPFRFLGKPDGRKKLVISFKNKIMHKRNC